MQQSTATLSVVTTATTPVTLELIHQFLTDAELRVHTSNVCLAIFNLKDFVGSS